MPSPRETSRTRLLSHFRASEQKFQASLSDTRARFNHAGNKGADLEGVMRTWLSEHLPRRLALGQGEVFDLQGRRASQIDILILDEEQPFQFPMETPGAYIVEGVAAAGEVKASLGSKELEDITSKAASFRVLQRSEDGRMAFSNKHQIERFGRRAPFFGFAFEGRISPDAVLSRLGEGGSRGGSIHPLDAIFVVGVGSFINLGDGQGNIRALGPSGQLLNGWAFEASLPPLALLFCWLNDSMPRFIATSSTVNKYLMETLSD